jgi:hypothetical protein
MTRPSIIISSLSGLLIIISIAFSIGKRDEFLKDSFKILILLLLIAIGLGIHSMSHYYEEIYFDFNPLVGKWKINDSPKKSEDNLKLKY